MKPMIILPPDVMSAEDLAVLRDNGICVVVAKNPAIVKFVDPIPCVSQRTQIEAAAIKMSRILLNGQWAFYDGSSQIGKSVFARIFADCLLAGTSLDAAGSKEEQEEKLFTEVKRDALYQLAKDEAKAEREAVKAKAAQSKPK